MHLCLALLSNISSTWGLLPLQVKGLRPGKSYSFRLEARFELPEGAKFEVEEVASSEKVTFSTPATVPTEPWQISLGNRAHNSLTVSPLHYICTDLALHVLHPGGANEAWFYSVPCGDISILQTAVLKPCTHLALLDQYLVDMSYRMHTFSQVYSNNSVSTLDKDNWVRQVKWQPPSECGGPEVQCYTLAMSPYAEGCAAALPFSIFEQVSFPGHLVKEMPY